MPQPSPSNPRKSGDSALASAIWIGASALALFLLARKPKLGLAVAAATGAAAFKTVRSRALESEYTATANFLINTGPERAYELWRNFAQLPRFMSHLKSVTVHDDRRSTWTALAPLGQEVSWDAEITHDVPNQQISWQSLPGAAVSNSGSVTFVPDSQGRGTSLIAQVKYTLPFGAASKALITALGSNPEFVLKEDVRRFKSLLEAGEAPTTQGQSHGPRGVHGAVSEALFREAGNHPDPQGGQPEPEPQLQTA